MRILDFDRVKEQGLDYKLDLVLATAVEEAKATGGRTGFFLSDLSRELGWSNPGGSQLRKLKHLLTEKGFELDKAYDADNNVVAWFAYITL